MSHRIFDDAVLSCGAFMAGRPDCVVLTVMAGVPDADVEATTFDVNCGFGTAVDAVRARRMEDEQAVKHLNAVAMHLDVLDGQYRGLSPDDPYRPPVTWNVEDLVKYVALLILHAVDSSRATMMLGPLGLLHPDHRIVSEAFLRAVKVCGLEAWLYEDLPARVEAPDVVAPALDLVRAHGFDPVLAFCGTGPRETKLAAVREYRSQLWALDEPCYLVPERFWRLWPA